MVFCKTGRISVIYYFEVSAIIPRFVFPLVTVIKSRIDIIMIINSKMLASVINKFISLQI